MAEMARLIEGLANTDAAVREANAQQLYRRGTELSHAVLKVWCSEPELAGLLLSQALAGTAETDLGKFFSATVGVAVTPENFEKLRAANGSPRLAEVPPDQDAKEFELHFDSQVRLDILTTRVPGGSGPVARFLERHGQGIQQVEYLTRNVDRAAELIRARFGLAPVYPATRAGADGTRVNFFLAPTPQGTKVLIELVEAPKRTQRVGLRSI